MSVAREPHHVVSLDDEEFMARACEEAKIGLESGGVPVGAVLVHGSEIVAAGRNRRVQDGDPIAHGEMDCLRNAGRRASYKDTTLYTTLSPCLMCAGTIVQFGIPRVVVGENRTFGGNEEFLREHGVEVVVLDDARCRELMEEFIRRYPDVWNEDIGAD